MVKISVITMTSNRSWVIFLLLRTRNSISVGVRHFCTLLARTCWVPGNGISMPRIRCQVRAQAEVSCCIVLDTKGVAVLHSSRKHVRSNNLYTTHLTRNQSSGPNKGHHVPKYYTYCNHVKSLLIYVVFQK